MFSLTASHYLCSRQVSLRTAMVSLGILAVAINGKLLYMIFVINVSYFFVNKFETFFL